MAAGYPKRELCVEKENGISFVGDVPVRCLYVTPLSQSAGLEDTLVKYFTEEDGPVEEVKIKKHKGGHKRCFALVTLVDYKNATHAFKNQRRTISHNNCTFNVFVRPANARHQPAIVLPPHAYKPNKISLSELNDECLLLVFGKLSAIDLGEIYGISDRYDDLLTTIARERYSYLDLLNDLRDKTDPFSTSRLSSVSAVKVIAALGVGVKALCVDGWYLISGHNEILKAVANHCPNLESMELVAFKVDGQEHIKEIFKRLRKFKIKYLGYNEPPFEVAENLRELTMSSTINGFHLSNLKDLTTLKLDHCSGISSSTLTTSLKLWGETLKKLSLKKCDGMDNTVINTIVNDLKVLDKLTISNPYPKVTNLTDLAESQSLTQLKIRSEEESSSNLLLLALGKENKLEKLNYSAPNMFYTMEYIRKMTNLKSLTIVPSGFTVFSSQSVIWVVEACENLAFLNVDNIIIRNETVFVNDLLNILILSHPNRPKLVLVVRDDIPLPLELINENKEILEVSIRPR